MNSDSYSFMSLIVLASDGTLLEGCQLDEYRYTFFSVGFCHWRFRSHLVFTSSVV